MDEESQLGAGSAVSSRSGSAGYDQAGVLVPAGVTLSEEQSGLLENQYYAGSPTSPGSPGKAAAAAAAAARRRRPSFAARFYEEAPAVFEGSDEEETDEVGADERTSLLDHHNHTAARRLSYLPPPEWGTTVLREAEASAPPGTESEPVIIREMEDKNGKITAVVAGQSTAPQTIFNSVNVLVGVGMLSLSLGFKYSGWLIGCIMMLASAASTYYTAGLLAKCMDTDHTLVTYADISYAAYGPRGRVLVSILFSLELAGAGVSMVVLFADSLNALFPQLSASEYKIIAFFIITPLCFLPLSVLSISSVLGIVSTTGLVIIVLFDGLYKQTSPGSLWEPMTTWLLPQNWMAVPLAIGIFMAPWGGHAVFPNIYRDMRHPAKYTACLVTTYQITFLLDMAMAVLGFLMFGASVSEEVSKSILLTPDGYPPALGLLMTTLIAIIPICKTPLSARPIVSTLDVLLNLQHVPLYLPCSVAQLRLLHISDILNRLLKVLLRVFVIAMFVFFSIVFPAFDRIIGLLGCSMCTTICVLGPIAFYLRIYGDSVSKAERMVCYLIFGVFAAVAVVGTVWCFMPPEMIEKGGFF